MRYISIITYMFVMSFIVFMNSCNEDTNPPLGADGNPSIIEITMQEKWNKHTKQPYKIEAKVEDPQGRDDIAVVQFSVYDSDILIYTDSLYDDGAFYHNKDGDVVAGDGIFTNLFMPDQIFSEENVGTFVFKFIASDRAGNDSKVAEKIIDCASNYPPYILYISAPDAYPWSTSEVVVQVAVADSDGIDDVLHAFFESREINSGVTKFEEFLYNDGDLDNHGDVVSGDSLFSVKLDSTFGVAKKGAYDLLFFAQDSYGEKNIVVPSHPITVENAAPLFKSISIPSSIIRPAANYKRELMFVEVADAQGLADIDSVYFYSLKPDSTWANNRIPLLLLDNGLPFNPSNPIIETGDVQAGDGKYSFSLIVESDFALGTYTFFIYIRDKAGNLAGPQTRHVTISED
jgi:hypothetical protein